MQAQMQAFIGGGAVETQEAKLPQVFDGTSSKVLSFVEAYRLYIGKKMKGEEVEEQILWALSQVQGRSTNMWKEKILEDLEEELQEYRTVEGFLEDIKKKFRKMERKRKNRAIEQKKIFGEGQKNFVTKKKTKGMSCQKSKQQERQIGVNFERYEERDEKKKKRQERERQEVSPEEKP